ncbi:MAG TPA: nitroreductase family protein [Acidimicrobiia bacterium]|jgi:nitroreductase
MDAWDTIRARRNVRDFTDEPIPQDDLDRILEAGRRAPSSKNGQPWDLVVVTDREMLEQLSRVWQAAGPVAGSAATIALVAPTGDDPRGGTVLHFDLGQLASTLTMAATSLGIGSGIVYVHDKALAAELLGLPEDRFAALLVTLGYPADRPLKPLGNPNRRALEEVVHRERWNESG